jgi:hypothetical protein
MDNIPDLVTDLDDEENEQNTEEGPYVDDQLEEENRLFTTTIPCEAEFIQATLNVSQ